MNFNNIEDFGCDLQSLHDWCNHQFSMKSMASSEITFGRTHKWFGYEVILVHPAVIKKGHWDEMVNRLGDRILPGWNCALLCHYRPGGGMIEHRDHSVFEPLVALVNIGSANFRIDNHEYHLTDGQVIKFNSNILHELLPVASDRWSLSFRRIKPQSLQF
ncbi:MAG: AraC family ligand binding domain-containing protein [Nostoc sp. ChiSLP02]|nr:AraC family ligand binding domain-containing protein [Nostoc sp. DedSLP05]MDZ8100182.1 AraC family ligand binding domain-containing protein [Nostoc sp. DedSLP01]MDZ8183270.1 AraC family ligand binding domain-containing protein [Nostoc sp. ChiSLP02]